jgi:hypothetical protein
MSGCERVLLRERVGGRRRRAGPQRSWWQARVRHHQWYASIAIRRARANQSLKRTGGTALVQSSVVQAHVSGGFAPRRLVRACGVKSEEEQPKRALPIPGVVSEHRSDILWGTSCIFLKRLKADGMPTVPDIPGPYRLFFYSFDCHEPPEAWHDHCGE